VTTSLWGAVVSGSAAAVVAQLLSLLSSFESLDRLDFDLEVLVLVDVSLLVFVALGFGVTFVVGVVRIGVRTGAMGTTRRTVGGGLLVVGAATGGGGGATGSCEEDELKSEAGEGGGT
jgi:hypothetical protein